jgi:hypothetical protein
MKLEVGDVLFSMTHGNPISELFSKVMGSPWSHSAICFGELNNETALLETNDYCVNINFFQRYVEDKNVSVHVLRRPGGLSHVERKKVQEQGRPLIGQLYGYLQLPILALRRLFKLRFRNFSRQGLVCCHVIGYSYQGIFSPMGEIKPESFDTQELYQMLVDAKWEVVFDKKSSLAA